MYTYIVNSYPYTEQYHISTETTPFELYHRENVESKINEK